MTVIVVVSYYYQPFVQWSSWYTHHLKPLVPLIHSLPLPLLLLLLLLVPTNNIHKPPLPIHKLKTRCTTTTIITPYYLLLLLLLTSRNPQYQTSPPLSP